MTLRMEFGNFFFSLFFVKRDHDVAVVKVKATRAKGPRCCYRSRLLRTLFFLFF